MCWRTDNAAANSNVQREPCEIWRAQLFSCAPYMIDHMFTQPPAPKHRGILLSFFPWHTTQRQHGTCAKWKRQNGIKGPIYKQPNGRHHYSETEVKLHSEEAMPRWDPGWKTTQFHYGVGGGGACGNSGVLCSETDRERERATDRQTERMELLPYKHVSIISHAHFITAKQNEYVFFLFSVWDGPANMQCLRQGKKANDIYTDIHMEHAHHIPVVSYNMHIYRKTACTTWKHKGNTTDMSRWLSVWISQGDDSRSLIEKTSTQDCRLLRLQNIWLNRRQQISTHFFVPTGKTWTQKAKHII